MVGYWYHGGYKGLKKLLGKDKKESMSDDIHDILAEEFEGTTVEEAEVVMAIRDYHDIQDHVERLGRMKNEDIQIADQLKTNSIQAAQFKDLATIT